MRGTTIIVGRVLVGRGLLRTVSVPQALKRMLNCMKQRVSVGTLYMYFYN